MLSLKGLQGRVKYRPAVILWIASKLMRCDSSTDERSGWKAGLLRRLLAWVNPLGTSFKLLKFGEFL